MSVVKLSKALHDISTSIKQLARLNPNAMIDNLKREHENLKDRVLKKKEQMKKKRFSQLLNEFPEFSDKFSKKSVSPGSEMGDPDNDNATLLQVPVSDTRNRSDSNKKSFQQSFAKIEKNLNDFEGFLTANKTRAKLSSTILDQRKKQIVALLQNTHDIKAHKINEQKKLDDLRTKVIKIATLYKQFMRPIAPSLPKKDGI